MRRAILMDRDGTISEEVGDVRDVAALSLIDGSAEAVLKANQAGFQTVVVTNQSGVARGILTEELVAEAHDRLRELLGEHGARLDGIYYCPHHPEAGEAPYRQDCDCRKPRPGLLTRAASDLGIDLARSWVVGDRKGDLQVAWAVGARGAIVKTGYGLGELRHHSASWKRPPDLVAEHLLEAVSRIVDARPA